MKSIFIPQKVGLKSLLFVFMLLVYAHAQAQTPKIIKGVIKSKTGELLMGNVTGAVISKTLPKDTSVICFALSDDKGNYALTLPDATDGYILTASSFGYAPAKFGLDSKNDITKLDFELVEQAVNIKEEAVITKKIWGEEKEDTITYNAKNYTNGTERTVEDLLRKIPGMAVDAKGNITINGKRVQTVLVEGEKMFGKNHKLITKNMPASVIDKVEIIDNYEENPLLKSLTQTGEQVINLSVKKDKLIRPFGNVGFGAGITDRYEAQTSMFNVKKRSQVGIIGNMNNIGYDPIEETLSSLGDDGNRDFSASALEDMQFQMAENKPFIADLSRERYNFNTARLLGANVNYKAKKRLKIRSFGYKFSDYLSGGNISKQTFFTGGQAGAQDITNTDSTGTFARPFSTVLQIVIDYKISDSLSVKAVTDIKNNINGENNVFSSQNINLSERILVNMNQNTNFFRQQVFFTKRLNKKQALTLDLSHSERFSPEQMNISSVRYADFFAISRDFNLLNQNVQQNGQETKAVLRLRGVQRKEKYNFGLGVLIKKDDFLSNINLEDSNLTKFTPANTPDNNFDNNITWKNTVFLGDFDYKFPVKKLKINISGNFQYFLTDFKNNLRNSLPNNERNNDFKAQTPVFNPNIFIGAKISRMSSFNLNFSQNQQVTNAQQLYDGFLLTDYRNFQNNQPLLNLQSSTNVSLGYRYSNLIDYIIISTTLSYSRNTSPYASRLRISNILNQQTLFPTNNTPQNYTAIINLEKLLVPLSCKMKWSGLVMQSENINEFQGVTRKQTSQNVSNTLSMFSIFKGVFNFDVASTWSFARFQLEEKGGGGTQNNQANAPNHTIRSNANITLNFNKEMSLVLSGEHFYWTNNKNTNQVYFADLKAWYRPKDSVWSFELSGKNLLNRNLLTVTNFSNFFISEQTYILQPRYIMLRLERSF